MSLRNSIIFVMQVAIVLPSPGDEQVIDEKQMCVDWKTSTVGAKGYLSDDDGKTFFNAEGETVDWQLEDGYSDSKCDNIAYMTAYGAIGFVIFATLAF